MGSRPSVANEPAVAELSRISVFGCEGVCGAAVVTAGCADLFAAFGAVDVVDAGAPFADAALEPDEEVDEPA